MDPSPIKTSLFFNFIHHNLNILFALLPKFFILKIIINFRFILFGFFFCSLSSFHFSFIIWWAFGGIYYHLLDFILIYIIHSSLMSYIMKSWLIRSSFTYRRSINYYLFWNIFWLNLLSLWFKDKGLIVLITLCCVLI